MRVVVGRIGKAHGIRGEVTVEVRTDEPEERFAPESTLLIAGGDSSLVVESVRPHGGGLLIGFRGVHDRTGAEALRGMILEVDRPVGSSPEDSDEYYDSDLIGCAVHDERGADLGVVTEVVHLPGQDLLCVRATTGGEWLLPLVHELVPQVDLSARIITARPPAGLVDMGGGE